MPKIQINLPSSTRSGATAFVVLLVGASACTEPTNYDWGTPPAIEAGDADCEPSDVQPSVCAWALSSDAVVVGEVLDVQWTNVPMMFTYADGVEEVIDSEVEALELCQTDPVRGLRFSMRVMDKLYASEGLPMSTKDVIDVTLGIRFLSHWSSHPIESDEDFKVTAWSGEEGVRPGDVLGVNLSLDKRGQATVGTDGFFTEVDGHVNFHEEGYHCVPYEGAPVDEASGSYQQLKDAVDGCKPSAAYDEELEQRGRVRDVWDVPYSQGAMCPLALTQTSPQ